MRREIFIVAGEASADMHAAALLRELKKLCPDLHAFGVGGAELAAEGMEILVDARALNVMGVLDWVDKVGEVLASYRKIKAAVAARRPDGAILLDLPDFNLKMAGHLKRLGVPVAYYISPQVWAWRQYRVKKIRRLVDRMLVVFPFEKEFYRQHGVEVEFVGHPLLDSLAAREGYRPQAEIALAPRIALLPGSRRSELKFHLPILLEVVRRLRNIYPRVELRLPVASTLDFDAIRSKAETVGIEAIRGNARETLAWADLAVVASGTATLETALIGTPFCLFYRVARTSALIFRYLVRYQSWIGMPNLLNRREVVKEFFQETAEPAAIFHECVRLIEDEPYRQSMARTLAASRELLGSSGASVRAAVQVADLLRHGTKTNPAFLGEPLAT